MKKKDYEKPMAQVVMLQHAAHLLTGSKVQVGFINPEEENME